MGAPLSRQFLLDRGRCCFNDCVNCPYVANDVQTPDGVVECEKPTSKRFKDLTDHEYGRLTVVDYYGKKPFVVKSGKRAGKTDYSHYWLCQCECGEQRLVQANNLRSGVTTSCGCYSREAVAERRTTHGLKSHPSYGRYHGMVARCTDPSHQSYPHYGGRGITVYPAWLEQKDALGLKRYLEYLDNVLGPCPGPEYSIERKENDKGYCPGNLEWADKSEQSRNRRCSKLTREDALLIKFGNLPGTQQELGEQFGVSPTAISQIRLGKTWADLTQADYDKHKEYK